jgi:hypothetical protein
VSAVSDDPSGRLLVVQRLLRRTACGGAAAAARYCRGSRAERPAGNSRSTTQETPMDDEALNLSIRKFLKVVGVSSQREIEQAVAKAVAAGTVAGAQTLAATMTLDIPALALKVTFDGEISLQ